MFQIIFNELSAAEMAALPKTLQLELLAEFQILPEDLDNLDASRFGVIRARGKETASLSGEGLPYLLRTESGGGDGSPRPAQEHAAGFSFPEQTADGGRRSAREDERILEVDRAGRTDAQGLDRAGRILVGF